ncbi:MAG: sugar phosphate isomerase/epimerase [Actinomycetia bacterium]|nr:sugar phosphate isomerase/epimerase [Actinomycetes bacterium]
MDKIPYPYIALDNRMFSSTQDLIYFASDNNYSAIDYSFHSNSQKLSDLDKDIKSIECILKSNIKLRYHCPFSKIEFAHSNREFANDSFLLIKKCIEIASHFNGEYLTAHIGLGFKKERDLSYQGAINNLSKLVEYGNKKNVRICLENMTTGWTNNPYSLLSLIKKTGASITFDLGHANSSSWINNNGKTSLEFLKSVSKYIVNAHVYEVEKIDNETSRSYHVAPENLNILQPLLGELIKAKCDWWAIELKDQGETNHTRSLLQSFLSKINPIKNISQQYSN